MNESTRPTLGRRKRPRVPTTSRKRVAVACEGCRRVREKCEDGVPCSRCRRLNRSCQVNINTHATSSNPPQVVSDDVCDDFFDVERIRALETLVHHYTDTTRLDKASLLQHVASLDYAHRRRVGTADDTPTPSDASIALSGATKASARPIRLNTFPCSGDLSHCMFFDNLQNKIDERSGVIKSKPARHVVATVVTSRTAHLRSNGATVLPATRVLPPVEVGRFLVDMFFRFAQTNYIYVDEITIRSQLESLYHNLSAQTADNASLLCTVLMAMALGTQFAHLSSMGDRDKVFSTDNELYEDIVSPDDNVAIALYHAATTLISDVLIDATLLSVQAFLLLGVYTLPIDAAGLSYSYLGVAKRLAVQLDMHRKPPPNVDPQLAEQRNRTWWTTHALESRVAALHGMPVALSRSQVDASMPEDASHSSTRKDTDNFANYMAVIHLTCILEDVGQVLCSFKQASNTERASIIRSLSEINHELNQYWDSLPQQVVCRDLRPDCALFRPNVHLALTYHLIRMFIGRTFIFDAAENRSADSAREMNQSSWTATRAALVSDCVESALTIIELSQLLQREVGLARASYTEFTSCRTAVLVVIARRIQENSVKLQVACESGLDVLKYMSVGVYSAGAEKTAIRAMETAVRRLNRKQTISIGAGKDVGESAYNNFHNWAKLWSKGGSDQQHSPSEGTQPLENMSAETHRCTTDRDTDMGSELTRDPNYAMTEFSFDLDDLASLTGFDPTFTFSPDRLQNITQLE